MPDNSSSQRSTRLDPTAGPTSGPKPQLPNHELLRCIGRGGFGEVWLARNIMGTYRAVKVIYRRNFSDERPYEREFRGLQKFEPISRSHDGFVDILDTGLDDAQGCFYYVMELADDVVSGNKIDPESYQPKTLDKEATKRGCVPVQTCVSLGVSLSAALSHLHQHGLLHRDIKPTNIIFVNGIPKIADIGLVSQVEGTQTFAGGTTGYYPPEEGPGTVQADIYALGKVLYELSTGQDRCEFPELPTGLGEMQDPDQFRELNQVILKACESDRQKRYRKAEDLHADLVLLMAGKSVRRIRVLEKRVAQLIQVGIAAALILLVGGGALYAWNRQQLRQQSKEQMRLNRIHGNTLAEEGDFLGALPFYGEALRLEQAMSLNEKNERLRIGVLLEQCPRMTQLMVLNGQNLNAAEFSRDGRYVITASRDGTATLCDVTQGSKREPWPRDQEIEAVAFSPDGRFVATAGKNFAKVWEMGTDKLVSSVNPPATVYSVKFSPDGSQFVTASGDDAEGHVYLYDTKKPGHGTKLTDSPNAYRCAAFSRDGTRLVTAGESGIAQVWDVTNRQPIGLPISHNQGTRISWIYCAAFSPDGRRVVTAAADGTVQVCEAETGRRIHLLRHPREVKSVGFSPDGRYIVTACWDYTTRIWDASTGELVYPTLKDGGMFLVYAAFCPDGRCVLTANVNGVICLWDLATPLGGRSPAKGRVLASQDGRRLCAIQGNNVDVFDAANHAHASGLLADALRDVRFNKDGSRLLTLSEKVRSERLTTLAQLWDTESGAPLSSPFSTGATPKDAFLSDDGRRLVTWKGDQATVWDAVAGRLFFSLSHAGEVRGGCFSPNGAWLATISATNVYVWNGLKGTLWCILPHIDSVEHVAFSPDSRLLVTCCGSPGTLSERAAQLWEVSSRTPLGPPLQHGDGVVYAEFNRDGTRVVTASEDGTARVWEVPTGKPLFPLEHKSTVTEARFSLDGRWIVTACVNGSARVWDAQTGEPLTPPLKHPWPFKHTQFIADSRAILSRRLSGVSMLWELPIETRDIEELAELAKVLSGHQRHFTGAFLPEEPRDIQKSWERLLAQHPRDFTVSQDDIINWHFREGEASEQTEQWSAAVFHWNKLIEIKPTEPSYHERLNRAQDHMNRTNALSPSSHI